MAEGERRAMVGAVEASTSMVEGRMEIGRTAVMLVCGSLVYYHCAYRGSSLLSLVSDVLLVLLCSLAILGMLFRQMNITVPVDPLEWQISQDTASAIVACLANTVGAAESVLRVAATGHDKRLFFKLWMSSEISADQATVWAQFEVCMAFPLLKDLAAALNEKVALTLYLLSALGRVASGATIAYVGLCLSCLYFFAQSSGLLSSYPTQFLKRRETTGSGVQDAM